MRVHCAYDEMKDVDLLTPHPRNANKHPEKQIKYLAKIMAHQGWRHPITVSKRSGSTLIACEKTKRRCFMMELDPKYVDVILTRWEKYTGKEAVRLEEGEHIEAEAANA